MNWKVLKVSCLFLVAFQNIALGSEDEEQNNQSNYRKLSVIRNGMLVYDPGHIDLRGTPDYDLVPGARRTQHNIKSNTKFLTIISSSYIKNCPQALMYTRLGDDLSKWNNYEETVKKIESNKISSDNTKNDVNKKLAKFEELNID